ncbi:DNA-binding response regulator [Candidatus Roizmanbacteria bacterium RIFOXYB2_FULL_41_10]|uniref:DNA-binding response regulator n=1 Tax=Candidatus Roizmanbacteria bacterium RIFOXYA1_FULL_41_12 TaxID=1802082 RepID=A0A1F7KF26_9BACT|nr:MAG: DNA-binding response regulator [Candidatus Roizmanbacteria bacterium RIFOXYA2_FULL_41_8]OGK66470.1 MAG: DNA-binding response regulator [Candidatus Roizmanbacteria bacterium RIFOXYA1_FULL_41_12]OGK66955.1 MAG: DNA-binding response regulator [Candidatus Roizmanbacteria bacterium RIFOXYB1_FULL_41_27]OGK71974.1 MAG: DNA-binding response regulator [Candidatus Roizmanbacteria bacterium RIFOXYC1_FULL_41_16]OGK72077.1 MAG: DNA-binding response regulator [Candidatus Roizmanbacteria bacterium RIF
MRILLIEDEHKLANAIKRALELQKYAVDVVYDGEEGFNLTIGEEACDLIISDIMLPSLDGIEFCKRIRQEGIHTPVLMLTAKGQIQDKVVGLDNGADDYMVKPFSFDELFARVRALVRRPKGERDPMLKIADLRLDPVNFKVIRAGKQIKLSTREFSILEYLMRNQNKVVGKKHLIAHVWDYDANILPGTVEVHIKNIRDKIDKPFTKRLIHTVRGFGYEIKVEN